MTITIERGRTAALRCLAVAAAVAAPGAAPPGDAPATTPAVVSQALATTRSRGPATVAVFTAPDQPDSLRLWDEFQSGAWARRNRGLVQLIQIDSGREPAYVRAAGVTHFPTVLVYARGPQGLTQVAALTECATADALADRLRALDLTAGPADPALVTASNSEVYPTLQNAAPPPPPPPPAQYQPQYQTPAQPQYQVQMQAPPQPMLQAGMTAGLVQIPSQNLMIQQAPPQIFVQPSPAPVVYTTLMAQPAPAQPAVAAAPAPNMFLSAAPAVAAAPAPAPAVAAAPAAAPPAPAYTLAASTPPAGAPAGAAVNGGGGTLAALTTQSLQLPASGTRTRLRVRGPGLLGSSAAWVGERLVRLGRTRIQAIQETTLEAPATQAAPTGVTTISTTSAAPMVAQQPTLILQTPSEVCTTPCNKPRCEKHCRERPPAPPQPPLEVPGKYATPQSGHFPR